MSGIVARQRIRARYANGVFTPLEPVSLSEGGEVVLEWVHEMHAAMSPGAWDDVPTDLAKTKKHDLYGGPREE